MTMTLSKSIVPVLQTWPVTVMELPTLVTIGLAQALVMLNVGVAQSTVKPQILPLVTVWPGSHALAPIAVTVFKILLWPHKDEFTTKFVLQEALAPAASESSVRTVPPAISSTKVILVKVMVPQLLTLP